MREVLVVALFVVLTVVMTWPLAPNLRTAVSDPGDPLLNAWILHWDQTALFDSSKSLWNAPVFHPAKLALAFSENMLGIALLMLPAKLAGASPLVVYNLAMLAGFALAGWGAYVLGRVLTGSTAAGIVAGVFFAFVEYRFDHLAHIQHIWSVWLPLLVAALVVTARRPTIANGVLLAIAFVMNGLTNVHWMLFGAVSVGLGALLLALGRSRFLDRRYWGVVGSALVVGVLVLVPVMWPYQEASDLYHMKRSIGETRFYSATPGDWFVAAERNRQWGDWADPARRHPERSLFPGLVILVLVGAGLALARREDEPEGAIRAAERIPFEENPKRLMRVLRSLDVAIVLASAWWIVELLNDAELRAHARPSQLREASASWIVLLALILARLFVRMPSWLSRSPTLTGRFARSRLSLETWLAILLVAIGVLGSLGLNAFFHEFLFSFFEAFQAIRVPARWAMIAYLGLAMLAAKSVVVLMRRAPRIARAIPVVVALLLLVDANAAPIRWYQTTGSTAPVYTWLKTAPFDGAVLELPMGKWDEYAMMLGATAHDRPLINGTSGFNPPVHALVSRLASSDPVSPRLIGELEKIDCSLIVVHNDYLNAGEALRAWLRNEVAAGRLAFVRRFDHGYGGDWVFALTKTEPDFAKLRAPEVPDPSGRTPLENAKLFLDSNARTYNGSTFGIVDVPRWGSTLRGSALVSGWAFSPHGIREIRILLANGRVVVPATLIDREDVRSGSYPWYPETKHCGYRASFPDRPDGVRAKTDLQVEIIDGDGRATRLPDNWITWRKGKPLPSFEWNDRALSDLVRRLGGDPATEVPRFHSGERTLRDVASVVLEATRTDSNEKFVERSYELVLGRPVDAGGRKSCLERLRKGGERKAIVDSLLSSEEFRKKNEAGK